MVLKKKVGRPPKGATKKSEWFSTRLTSDLFERIDAAAKTNGITRSEEIQQRLEASFQSDRQQVMLDEFGGQKNYALCLLIAKLITFLTAKSGKSWADDPWTYLRLERGVGDFLQLWRPPGKPVRPKSLPADVGDDLGERAARHLEAAIDFADPGSLLRRLQLDVGQMRRPHPERED
jgi:hypothetical protein